MRDDISAFSSGGPFTGFTAGDFDAYQEKKWRSNAFTLERRRAKDKLLAVAQAIRVELEEEVGKLELLGSDEAPAVANGRKVEAQWACFVRDAETRAALKPLLQKTDLAAGANLFDIALQHQHASLLLRLDVQGIWVGFEIAGKAKVDRNNTVQKLKQEWARKKLIELCQELPGNTRIGIGDRMKGAIDLNGDVIESWFDPLEKSDALFGAISLIPRDEPVLGSEAVIGTMVELLSEFQPIYAFLAWSRDNDYTQLKDQIKKTTEQKQKQQKQQQQQIKTLQPGDRVTILSGLFAGRGGYLAEIDGKGKAKVMVGPVSVSVEAKDLKPV